MKKTSFLGQEIRENQQIVTGANSKTTIEPETLYSTLGEHSCVGQI